MEEEERGRQRMEMIQEGGPIDENRHFCFQSFLTAAGTEAVSIFLLALSKLMLPRGGRHLGQHNSSLPFPCRVAI